MPESSNLIIREVSVGSADYERELALREEVLRRPLGLRFTPEEIAKEADCVHLVGLLDGCVVATLLLEPQSATAMKMRQVAVRADLRGQGVGSLLLAAAEACARERGSTRLTAHARATALAFYERHGYAAAGEIFIEATIPHRLVSKEL